MKTSNRVLKIIGFSLLGIIGLVIVAVMGFFVATRGRYSVPATVEDDLTLPSVTIDGVTFHAETFGDPNNPAVVVVHGGPDGTPGVSLTTAGAQIPIDEPGDR